MVLPSMGGGEFSSNVRYVILYGGIQAGFDNALLMLYSMRIR